MEVLKTIVFGLFLIGLALYLLAQLITPVGVIALIVVIVLICFGVAQGKRRGEERQQAEEALAGCPADAISNNGAVA